MKNVIYITVVLAVMVKVGFLSNPFDFLNNQSAAVTLDGPVVMYSTSWCGYCVKAKNLFKEKGIDYVEYDIEKSFKAKREFDALKGRATPLFVINGQVVKGYDKVFLSRLKNTL